MAKLRSIPIAVMLVVLGLSLTACGYNPATHSTSGVVLTDAENGVATVPAGEILVLKKTQSCGKTTCTYFWRFVTNGDGKLTVTDDQLFEDRVREFTLSKGAKTEISTYWLSESLYASLDANGNVLVDWPTGFWSRWTYRNYDPPQ